jgi:hypothetical protein
MPAAERYTAVDTIALTVRNGSGQTIYVEAHFTDCSIIALERFVAGAWQPVTGCVDGFPHPYVERIPPGTTLAIQLTSVSGTGGATESASSSWPAGTYRAELMYTTSATAAFAQGTAVYSATFSVE